MSVDLAKLMIEINIVGNPIDAASTKIIPNKIVSDYSYLNPVAFQLQDPNFH